MQRILTLVCCMTLAAPAFALRCGSGIVDTGDITLKLVRLCGQPTLKEQQERRVLTRSYDQVRGVYFDDYLTVPYEVWTYNFGPQRFVQRITLEDGKIKHIESSGYGY